MKNRNRKEAEIFGISITVKKNPKPTARKRELNIKRVSPPERSKT